MRNIPSFPYSLLWGERTIRTVANSTRHDATQFLTLCSRVQIPTSPVLFPSEDANQDANQALLALRAGKFEGATVLKP